MCKKIIFITRHDPSKLGGGSFATRAYLEALNKIYFNRVTLFVCNDFDENILVYKSAEVIKVPARSNTKAILGIFTGKLTRFQVAINDWLNKNNENLGLVIFDGSIIGGTYCDVFKRCNCKTVTIHHNYEIEYHKENRSIESLKGYFFYWIKKLEKKAYLNSDLNLFLTQSDLVEFQGHYGKSKSNKVIGCFEFPNIIEEPSQYTVYKNQSNIRLIISGSLNSVQTIDGINWFVHDIYDRLIKLYPNLELTITGRSPKGELVKLCKNKGIRLIVSPINIREIINQNDIYICPIRLGGGLKLRVMDALSLGIPSIIHQKSFRGYENLVDTNLVSEFKNEDGFMEIFNKMVSVLNQETYSRDELKLAYQERFSFDSGLNRLDNYLEKVFSR